jgi:hypothetical protein
MKGFSDVMVRYRKLSVTSAHHNGNKNTNCGKTEPFCHITVFTRFIKTYSVRVKRSAGIGWGSGKQTFSLPAVLHQTKQEN